VRGRFRGLGSLVGTAVAVTTLVTPPRPASADPILGGDALELSAERLMSMSRRYGRADGHVTLVRGLRVDCPHRRSLRRGAARHLGQASGGVADIRGVHAEAPRWSSISPPHPRSRRCPPERGQGWLNADKATIEIATAKVTSKT
jgi:hypothetical protein